MRWPRHRSRRRRSAPRACAPRSPRSRVREAVAAACRQPFRRSPRSGPLGGGAATRPPDSRDDTPKLAGADHQQHRERHDHAAPDPPQPRERHTVVIDPDGDVVDLRHVLEERNSPGLKRTQRGECGRARTRSCSDRDDQPVVPRADGRDLQRAQDIVGTPRHEALELMAHEHRRDRSDFPPASDRACALNNAGCSTRSTSRCSRADAAWGGVRRVAGVRDAAASRGGAPRSMAQPSSTGTRRSLRRCELVVHGRKGLDQTIHEPSDRRFTPPIMGHISPPVQRRVGTADILFRQDHTQKQGDREQDRLRCQGSMGSARIRSGGLASQARIR